MGVSLEFSCNFDAFPEVENELTAGSSVGVPRHWRSKVHVGEGAGAATHIVLVSPVTLANSKGVLSILLIYTNVGPVS